METSCVFLIFATAFLCVQSYGVRLKKDINYTEVVTDVCTPEYREDWSVTLRDVMKNASCKPHYRLVNLQPKPGHTFIPSSVSVKRCDGPFDPEKGIFCAPNVTGTRFIKLPVILWTLDQNSRPNQSECTVVSIEEHHSCNYVCKEQVSDCNAEQEYDRHRCKCVYKNWETRKDECSKLKAIKKWDDEDCQCKCREATTTCGTHYKWNHKQCKCVCKNLKARKHCSKSKTIKKWDDEDCQCKCRKTNTNCTTPGYKWNLEQCKCVEA